MAYTFYLDGEALPVTPDKLQRKRNGRNKTFFLLNGQEANVLSAPGLRELTFDARLPQTRYPFAADNDAAYYLNKLERLAKRKRPFRFIVTRESPDGCAFFDTNLRVSLEEYTILEDAGEGYDVLVSIRLKEYRPFSTMAAPAELWLEANPSSTRDGGGDGGGGGSHTVVKGDCLWNIAQAYLGNGARYPELYARNQAVIDEKNRGTGNPSYTIYPGQVLQIPAG